MSVLILLAAVVVEESSTIVAYRLVVAIQKWLEVEAPFNVVALDLVVTSIFTVTKSLLHSRRDG